MLDTTSARTSGSTAAIDPVTRTSSPGFSPPSPARSVGRREREERAQDGAGEERVRDLRDVHELERPADVDEPRAGDPHQAEDGPLLSRRDDDDARVEEREVAEEGEGAILAGRDEVRREEAAEEAEDGEHERVALHRHDAGGQGDEDHPDERDGRGEEVPEGVRREERGVERRDTRAADRLSGAVRLLAEPIAADERPRAEDEAERDAKRGRDEVLLDGIVEEERGCDEERGAAEPGEEADADEGLPVEGGAGRSGRRSDPGAGGGDGGGGAGGGFGRVVEIGVGGARCSRGERFVRPLTPGPSPQNETRGEGRRKSRWLPLSLYGRGGSGVRARGVRARGVGARGVGARGMRARRVRARDTVLFELPDLPLGPLQPPLHPRQSPRELPRMLLRTHFPSG